MSHRLRISDDGRQLVHVLTPRLAVFMGLNRGKEFEWDFVPKKRSLAQNARHWKVIVPAFEQLGYETFSKWAELNGASSKDSAHNVIKRMFLDPLEWVDKDGVVYEILPSSASLTTAQFSQMDEKAERYLNELGIFLPAQDEE